MNKIFFVSTENTCNNNCIGCADKSRIKIKKTKNGRPTIEIFQDLKKGAKKGFKNIHFTGGEITIQDNFFEIISKAVQLYEKVYITSNGRMFSNKEFAKKTIKQGVTDINITLAGQNSEIHEKWTQVPKSFMQTIKGIQNLRKYTKNITLNILIWKENYQKLSNILKIAKKLKIKKIDLFNLVPLGNAKKIYKKIKVDVSNLIKIENQIIPFQKYFNSIEIEDFPKCIFSKKFEAMENIHIFDTSGKIFLNKKNEIINYSVFAAREMNIPILNNFSVQDNIKELQEKIQNYRIKINACLTCPRKDNCEGIFSYYIKLKGKNKVEKELENLKKINN